MKIRTRLMLAFAGCGMIPIALVGYLSYRTAIRGMENVKNEAATAFSERAQAQLVALRDVKKGQFDRYCKDRHADLLSLLGNVEALRRTTFGTLDAVHANKKINVEGEFKKLLTSTRVLGETQDTKSLFQRLKEYHDFMETKADQPFDVTTAKYQEINNSVGRFLRDYVELECCRDAYIICMAHGHVMFSIGGKEDAGTNLDHGPYKNEGLARLWQQVKQTKAQSVVDFAPYTPRGGEWVAFVGSPILDDAGDMMGLLALQIGADRFNRVVQNRDGLGVTGESYLVGLSGGQGSYRSDRVVRNGKVGEAKSDVDVDKALAGQSGHMQKVGTTGTLQLSCYAPLDIPDVKWAMITTMTMEEVLAPKIEGRDDFYKTFTKVYGYYDLFLFDPQGYCFYSVAREKDFQTNMVNGPYKDSNFGVMVQKVLRTKEFAFADFAPTRPATVSRRLLSERRC